MEARPSFCILIVDDMEKHATTLARALEQHGFHVGKAGDSATAWKRLEEGHWSLVLLDIRLGSENGMDVLRRMRGRFPTLPVLMITAFGAVAGAVEALKLGAVDYLEKPLRMDTLLRLIRTYASPRQDARNGAIITSDPAMLEIIDRSRRAAVSDIPVLIYGESGTGKELLADAIHRASVRRDLPLIKANCAALPESLLDNELFGHEKGSFTGADSAHAGLFERADGGTLFLDEIGDMALATQSRILRAIHNREIWRIGASLPKSVNVRFICATNRDVEELISRGLFRRDLYYRLNACTFTIPPLRDRPGDIPALCEHFCAEFSPSGHRLRLAEEVLEIFLAYDWPGNVRELQNTIQYAASMAVGEVVDAGALPEKVFRGNVKNGLDLAEDEKRRIIEALRQNAYSRGKTADSLRMNRATLYRKMRKHGIQ